MSASVRPIDAAAATRPGLGHHLLLGAAALWILCAGVALILWLLTWSRAPGTLLQTVPLDREGVVTQAIALPDDGLERLGLVVDKQGESWPAVVEVVILDGEALPASQAELAARTLGTVRLRVHGQGVQRLVWRPLDAELPLAAGRRLQLLVRRLDARTSTLALWLGPPNGVHVGPARALRAGEAGQPQTSTLDGSVAVHLARVPLRGVRHLAWLGLWGLGFCLLAVGWSRAGTATRGEMAAASASTGDRRWGQASLAAIALAGVAVSAAVPAAGIAWDEAGLAAYGGFLVEYYARWLPDAAIVDHYPLFNLHLYGGAFELALAALDRLSPLDPWPTRHLLTGLVGVAGLLAVRALTRRLAGPRAALWAVLLLALLPAYSGHWLNNTKDLPFAVGCAWSLVCLVDVVAALPTVSPRLGLRLAVAMGLTMGVRVAGVLLPGLALLALLGWGLGRWRVGHDLRQTLGELGAALGRLWVPATALAWALMVALWPWAQQAPLANPLRALLGFGRFSDYTDGVLLAGQSYLASQVPASYLPHYLLVTLPELHLALLGLVLLVGARAAWRTRLRLDATGGALALTAALALLPLLGAVLVRPSLYDGIRQVLFVLPPLCALAAVALDRVLGAAWRRARALAAGLGLVALLAAADLAHTTLQLAPYQYAHYNRLVGGLPGAQGRYELDYWGLCYREAVAELQRVLAPRGLAPSPEQPLRVASCGDRASAEAFFPSTWRWVAEPAGARFVLTHRRASCAWQELGQRVARVERAGVTLCEVREVTP